MKRAQTTSASPVARMLHAAAEAWDRRDLQQSIDILERANPHDPSHGVLLLQLGRYHGMRYDYAAAEKCFDQAIHLATRKTQVTALAAELSMDFISHHLAERYFNLALKQKDASAEIFVRLAELYEHLSRPADARALVDRALQSNSLCAPALLVRARLDRRDGRLDDAEKSLRSFVFKAPPETRIRGYYELGAVLDQLGRYDEAMTAFLQAKEMLRPDTLRWIPKLEAYRALLTESQAALTVETMQRWSDFGSQLKPARRLALLAGHPRSGTTLLEQVLDSHPGIVSAGETQIFMNDALRPLKAIQPDEPPSLTALDSAGAEGLQQSRANYFRSMELHLGQTIGPRLLIDKNPALTAFIPAYVRVFPEIKLLVALRDPRDVVLSCFMQAYVPITLGSVSYHSLQGAADVYALIMGGWRASIPLLKHPCLAVRYEDTVEDLTAVSRRVLEFLDIPWDARVLAFHEHARLKRVRSPACADVTRPIFQRAVGRWRNYQKYLEPYLGKLAPFIKAFGYA